MTELEIAEAKLMGAVDTLNKVNQRIQMYKNNPDPKAYVALCKVSLMKPEAEAMVDTAYREFHAAYRSSR